VALLAIYNNHDFSFNSIVHFQKCIHYFCFLDNSTYILCIFLCSTSFCREMGSKKEILGANCNSCYCINIFNCFSNRNSDWLVYAVFILARMEKRCCLNPLSGHLSNCKTRHKFCSTTE